MPIKSVKMKISKNKKMRFFLMSQGSLNPKIRFLGQKMCSAARGRTDTHTHTKVKTEDILSGFQEFFLQLIIKERSNKKHLLPYQDSHSSKLSRPNEEVTSELDNRLITLSSSDEVSGRT